MIFKVSRSAYTGGDEYSIHRHEDGLEFYRGPSIPESIFKVMAGRPAVYFDWGYDEPTHSVDVTGPEVPDPAEG